MEEKRTSIFENGLIWFGAGVSIAEILTGTYLAPLGFKRGLAAIVLGHIIGCVMLFLAGVIGGKARRSAMETVKMSFGQKGSLLFSVLNVLQLVGWTAIMIYDGALAANGVVRTGRWAWCLVIGILIILWIMIGITNLGKVNAFAMTALFILTLILCKMCIRDSRKMSLNELSKEVGISNVNLSNLKTGKVKAIRFSTLESICDVLDCQPGDILEYRRET